MVFFDGDDVKDALVLEPGRYTGIISGAETGIPNKNKTGELTWVTFEVEGEEQTIKKSFNLVHDNKTAENISKVEFKKVVVLATGDAKLESLEDLIGKRVGLNISVKEWEGQERNEVKGFFAPTKSEDLPF